MATELLNAVRTSCPRDIEYIKNTLATKTEMDSFNEMTQNGAYSFYATPLRNGEIVRSSDILVGFIADTPTTFTFSVCKIISLTKSLKKGEFQFAFFNEPYPIISTMGLDVSISNVNGSGYVIYANVINDLRRRMMSKISLGDYCFGGKNGLVYPSDWADFLNLDDTTNTSTTLIDYIRQSPYMSNPRIKSIVDVCKTDSTFRELTWYS